MYSSKKCLMITVLMVLVCLVGNAQSLSVIVGKVLSPEQEVIGFAQIRLKGTQYISTSDDKGNFRLKAPAGAYTLMVSAFGYQTVEKSRVAAWATNKTKLDVTAKRK